MRRILRRERLRSIFPRRQTIDFKDKNTLYKISALGTNMRWEPMPRFGYYQGKVTNTVDGLRLDDPRLPDAIDALPKETNASIKVNVELGTLYHLRKVTIEGDIPENARAKLGIRSGDPAVASEVLKAQERLLTALQEDGHALAAVDLPIAYEDPAAQVLDVTYKVRAGPRVDIGEISVTGLQQVNASVVRNRLLIHTGERDSPRQIEKARQELLALGVFSCGTGRA